MISAKIAIESATERMNKFDCDIDTNKSAIHEIKTNAVRLEERLFVIQKNQELQAADMRSIRNSVVGAIIGAIILGIGGLAVNSFHSPHSANTTNSSRSK